MDCFIHYPLFTIIFPVFTGIIETTAPVLNNEGTKLILGRPSMYDHLLIGASIAVSGVCLSIVHFDDDTMTFDVVRETREKSKIGSLTKGDIVNLERSVLADQRLDGHLVQGHVEGVGEVREIGDRESGGVLLVIDVPSELNTFFVQKGSVAIDGVSLTIAKRTSEHMTIALVPHTLEKTTLGLLQEGDKVNLETDIVGRYLYAFTHEAVTK